MDSRLRHLQRTARQGKTARGPVSTVQAVAAAAGRQIAATSQAASQQEAPDTAHVPFLCPHLYLPSGHPAASRSAPCWQQRWRHPLCLCRRGLWRQWRLRPRAPGQRPPPQQTAAAAGAVAAAATGPGRRGCRRRWPCWQLAGLLIRPLDRWPLPDCSAVDSSQLGSSQGTSAPVRQPWKRTMPGGGASAGHRRRHRSSNRRSRQLHHLGCR
jgi:hypothetical protein